MTPTSPVAALQPASHEQSGNPTKVTPPKGSRLISEKQLRLPGVGLLTIRTRKHWPASFLDQCVATAKKAGVGWTWLPCGGDEANPLSAVSLEARYGLYWDFTTKYRSDPSLYAVHAFVAPPKHSEEGFWGRPMSKAAKNAQKATIAYCAEFFPRQKIIWTGAANDPAANIEIIKFGVDVAPDRFGYKMNAMSPKKNMGWAGNTLLIEAAKLGADICFEALQPSNHQRFGGSWTDFVAKVKEIERRAGKRFSYAALYPLDLVRAGGLK
jgi:hypothetical protein